MKFFKLFICCLIFNAQFSLASDEVIELDLDKKRINLGRTAIAEELDYTLRLKRSAQTPSKVTLVYKAYIHTAESCVSKNTFNPNQCDRYDVGSGFSKGKLTLDFSEIPRLESHAVEVINVKLYRETYFQKLFAKVLSVESKELYDIKLKNVNGMHFGFLGFPSPYTRYIYFRPQLP